MASRVDTVATGTADHPQHFHAYVSVPDQPNGNAIIVLQEIFGVTSSIREVADRFAQAGYLAVAPELFWRVEHGIELGYSKEGMSRAFQIVKDFSDDAALADIDSTVAHIKALPGFKGRIAVSGLCLGGKLTVMAAARQTFDAAVAFYGVGIENHLDDAARIACPTLMFFGGADKYVSAEARQSIQAAVAGKAEVVVYPEADHGFYTRGTPDLLGDAHQRTLAFLAKALRAEQAVQ